jgi:hypothetical protein
VGSVTYKDSKIVIDSIKARHNRPAACIACLVLGRRPCLLATGTLCSLQEAGPLEYAGHHADDRNDPLEEPPVRTAAAAHETPPSPPLPGDFLLIEDYSKPGVSQALSQVRRLTKGNFEYHSYLEAYAKLDVAQASLQVRSLRGGGFA